MAYSQYLEQFFEETKQRRIEEMKKDAKVSDAILTEED